MNRRPVMAISVLILLAVWTAWITPRSASSQSQQLAEGSRLKWEPFRHGKAQIARHGRLDRFQVQAIADGSSIDPSPLPGTSPQKRPFSIQQQGEIAWLVRPNGERCSSFGVCRVDRGASRE